jgi:hypothetical protein
MGIHNSARILRRTFLTGAAFPFLVPKARAVNLLSAPSATGPVGIPSPPALQGAVHHIPPSGSDQTAVVQAAINGAAAGDTIFFDSGTHVINGTITPQSNLLYIGPTQQFSGQARAVLTGGSWGSDGGLRNAVFYGLGVQANQTWGFSGHSGVSFTNMSWDNTATGVDCWVWTDDNNGTVQWCTFRGGGSDNNGGAHNVTNRLMTRNQFYNTPGDAIAGDFHVSSNCTISFNYINGSNRIALECQGQQRNGLFVTDNHIENMLSGGFAYSIVGGGQNIVIARNFAQGPGAAIEWDMDNANNPGGYVDVSDNYMRGPGVGIFGPYQSNPASKLYNNNLFPDGAAGETCGNGGNMPCDQVQYIPATAVDLGKPQIPASGAGP